MKKILFAWMALSVASLAILKTASAEKLAEEIVSKVSKTFADNLDCSANSKDVWRLWCGVTRIPQNAQPLALPQALTTYLGVSVQIKEEEPLKTSFLNRTSLSALVLGPHTAKLESIKPSNPEEEKDIVKALAFTSLALKVGDHYSMEVSPAFLSFLKGLGQGPGHPLAVQGKSGSYMGRLPSLIYRAAGLNSGDVFVVIEEASDGTFVSIFPTIGQIK